MSESEWKAFLTEYNRELLSYEEVVEHLSPALIKAGWLGYAGATAEQISTIEKRLATHLPPSYRAFLKVSNGWRFPSVSIFDLLPTSKIVWFREQNQDWIDTYIEASSDAPPISDAEYFVYGDKQDCVNFRAEYLQTALQISELCDSAVVLLNPKVVSADGEWEIWFFANWLPGAVRYRSFDEWLKAERLNCSKQLKPLPKTKVQKYVTAKKPVSVKKAQAAARGGQTEVALESLESFAEKGDDSAAASLAELYAFLGQWDKVIVNAGRLIANPGAVYAGNVFNDMIKLLGRAGHSSGEWQRVIEVAEKAMKANASQNYDQHHEWVRDKNGKVFRNLIEYAKRQGKPPHELIAIFPMPDYLKQVTDLSQEQLKVRYEKAVKIADSIPHLKTPQAKAEHLFSLIKDECQDEALKLYEVHGANFLMAWQAAEYVAGIHVRRGNSDSAWAAISANFNKWWPVDNAQVTPLILLTDEHLNAMMTPERCQFVLSTPRGPEAVKKDK